MPTDSSTTTDLLRCPRCERAQLASAGGSGLLDSPCWSCGGTFVPPAGVTRLIHDEHGIDVPTLRALMGEHAGTQLTCPACSYTMSHLQLKGVPLELCTGCGGVWLDEGELHRLSFGRYHYERPPEPAPPEPVYTKPVPAEPVDAQFEPVVEVPAPTSDRDIVGRHGGERARTWRGGCLKALGFVHAGGFGVVMLSIGIVTEAWSLMLVGVGALGLALLVLSDGRWPSSLFSAKRLPGGKSPSGEPK